MDYSSDFEDIEYKLEAILDESISIRQNGAAQVVGLINLREQISGDTIKINDNLEKLNTSINLVAIILAFALIYNFIVRSLK